MALYFQGDICIELVDAAAPGPLRPAPAGGEHVLAWGELTGHRHAASGDVQFVHGPSGMPGELEALYIGRLIVGEAGAVIRHEEHAPIQLARGTYRVRRQREYEDSLTRAGRLVAD